VWDAASHVFATDVTLTNSSSATLPGLRAILRAPQPDTLRVINPSGYASDDAAFIEFGAVAAGASQTAKWRIYSPNDTVGSFRVDITSVTGRLGLTTAAPASFSATNDTVVTVRGTDFRAETAFFIESTRLVVKSWTTTTADVVVPAGFPAATYGVMAANPNGERAVLYPAFTVTPAAPLPPLDPKVHARSFVDGYVTDITTRKPIVGATVSVPGLSTTTTSDGYFLLQGVPQGHIPVRIDADGYERVYRFAEVQGEQQTVSLKLAELQPKSTAVTMIGAEGGTHYANDGSFIKIPAGALDQTVPIQFTQLSAANALPQLPQDGYFLAFARLGPVGLTFKKPATLYLPLQTGIVMPVGTPIHISYYDERQNQWVQDITGGIITEVNGRLFLQYEINHFTWIGGQSWLPLNPVNGRVVFPDGSPVPNVWTSFGLTDGNGYYSGSASGSSSPRTIRSYAYRGGDEASVEASADINGAPVKFPDITVPRYSHPQFSEPRVIDDSPCVSSNGAGISTRSGVSPQNVIAQEAPDQIVNDKSVAPISTTVWNYRYTDIDLSRSAVLLNGRDVTNQADINRTESSGDVTLEIKLSSANLKYGENHVEIQLFSKSLGVVSKETKVYKISKLSAANASVMVLPDDQIPAEIKTPIIGSASGSVSYVFRQSDAIDGLFPVHLPVTAVDDMGNTINMTTTTRFKFRGNDYLGAYDDSRAFVSGVANPVVMVDSSGIAATVDLAALVPDYYYLYSPTSIKSLLTVAPCGQGDNLPLDKPTSVNIFDKIYATRIGGAITNWIAGFSAVKECVGSFCFTIGDATTIGWSLVPFAGDISTLGQEGVNALLGKGVDPTVAVLAVGSLGMELSGAGLPEGEATAGLIGVMKVSKDAGSGLMAGLITSVKDVHQRRLQTTLWH